jgi:hypothetical protein
VVRERIVRAFLIEEQKIVKKVQAPLLLSGVWRGLGGQEYVCASDVLAGLGPFEGEGGWAGVRGKGWYLDVRDVEWEVQGTACVDGRAGEG